MAPINAADTFRFLEATTPPLIKAGSIFQLTLKYSYSYSEATWLPEGLLVIYEEPITIIDSATGEVIASRFTMVGKYVAASLGTIKAKAVFEVRAPPSSGVWQLTAVGAYKISDTKTMGDPSNTYRFDLVISGGDLDRYIDYAGRTVERVPIPEFPYMAALTAAGFLSVFTIRRHRKSYAVTL